MSMLSQKTRIAAATCLALVQLSVLPATYVLHIGCDDPHCSHTAGTVECGHGHSCPFHHHHSDEEKPKKSSHHDSDQCRVCQVAFASTIASPEVAEISCSGTVAVLSHGNAVEFDSAQPYCHPGRGPPAC